MRSWWIWWIDRPPYDGTRGNWYGPHLFTIGEAFHEEFMIEYSNPGARLYRWVWSPTRGWLYDARSRPELLAAA
jgi:hypothetical protein